MSTAQPWMKFYPQDWRADEKLRMCSLAARGLWLEMLALMHRSEKYGQLLIGGIVPTHAQIAIQVGASEIEVSDMIGQLESAGVFSRAAGGAIYSRRMNRDEKKAKTARKNGKSGGNPTLKKQTENPPSVKGEDKASDKGGLNTQKPEARSQRPESTNQHPQPRQPVNLPADVRSVMEEGGFVTPPPDLGMLREWYGAGATLDQDILPMVRKVAASLSKPPFKLKVFDAAIREKLAADEREIARLESVTRRYSEAPEAAAGGVR